MVLTMIIVMPLLTMAQVVDTTGVTPLPTGGATIMDYFWWILGFFVTVIYPIMVRLIPTTKNWDWLQGLIRILALIFPNKKKGGGTL